MSFQIERGLFKYDLVDHHAVLCVRLDADVAEIRKRYLQIARSLHPDSCSAANDKEKQLASQLLSKLVNPAYEHLYHDKSRAEYNAVLTQMAKHLAKEFSCADLTTDNAKQLANTPNFESAYRSVVSQIAKVQYNSLIQVLDAIAQISELNLVYLMRSADKPSSTISSTNTASQAKSNPGNGTPSQPPQPKEDPVFTGYMRRAQELIIKNQLSKARVELQDALKLQPNNSQCHSLIGTIYLKQNQIKMAKIHFDRALQLDPKDQTALEAKTKIDKALGKTPVTSTTKKNPVSAAAGKSPKPDSGGLFGGLFGGKKK
ncbi:MAG: J domain-containing protein [Richelia sp. RM2_1_2]|nr:J domain-containing protein [Richelia sp. RM1_1_1]NJO61395.1 J domain-containing protein [Richelia sp. RM2_1_2]